MDHDKNNLLEILEGLIVNGTLKFVDQPSSTDGQSGKQILSQALAPALAVNALIIS